MNIWYSKSDIYSQAVESGAENVFKVIHAPLDVTAAMGHWNKRQIIKQCSGGLSTKIIWTVMVRVPSGKGIFNLNCIFLHFTEKENER